MTGDRQAGPRSVLLLTLAAVALRLVMFLGRGDYLAFDEGWYLLLGRNLFSGDGYTLSGLRHTTLSPLFPILAGATGAVLRDPIWAGRLVAAVTAGLVVWPCWHIFRRIGGRRTALVGCAFVAVMPALTPFVAAYWIGWDLWVGAEPVLQFFLYSALALTLRARERQRTGDWLLAGAAFALAYLARPEAILPFGIIGLLLLLFAARTRSLRTVGHAAALGVAFALTAAPYWIYLHDVLDRWTLTGRAIELSAPAARGGSAPAAAPSGAAATIEHMLWGGDEKPYVQVLYGLHPSGTRLASTYWGVPDRTAAAPGAAGARVAPVPPPEVQPAGPASLPEPPLQPRRASRLELYLRALGRVVPWYVWPLVGVGLLAARAAWRTELFLLVPLFGASAAIAAIVAVDPRTQLFIVPLAAFYAARGIGVTGVFVDRRLRRGRFRRGFVRLALTATVFTLLLGTDARWLWLSTTLGSPHHVVGEANRRAGEALREVLPADEPLMSWHPAHALYARRDWRVLPYAEFPDVVRYANAIESEFVLLSVYYPMPQLLDEMPQEHLLVHVPPGTAAADSWNIRFADGAGPYLVGRLTPRSSP